MTVTDTAANPSIVAVLSGERRTPGAAALRAVARCAEPFYTAAIRVRNDRFDTRRRKAHRAHVPVVSIGNLTTGGTGKTPMVIHVAQRLAEAGLKPAVVLRGYKADRRGNSDEAQLLGAELPGAPVIVNPDRVAAARFAQTHHPEVDVLVLDDAFQHRRIARDFDMVLIDATNPFGFDHLLPRGLLREPPDSLARADAVVITRADQVSLAELDQLDRRIAHHHGRQPVARCVHHWRHTLDEHGAHAPTAGARVFAFCGIGNPAAFFHQIETRLEMVGARSFADHHDYTAADVDALCDQAERRGAKALLTTEKDWVKLNRVLESHPSRLPVWRAHLEIEFSRGRDALAGRLLAAVIPTHAQDPRPADERTD